ncbi:MAG: tyrosine-type recombinase/integrase [Euzebya sp.]
MGRARGEGGLSWHAGKGVWVGRYRGRDVSSKSKAEAAAKLEALRAGDLPRPRQTVGDVLDWWTSEHLEQRVSTGAITRRTAASYVGQAAHLQGLRGVRLSALDATVVDRHLALLAETFSPRTVQYTRAVLRIAMRAAAAKRLVPMSVADAVSLSESVQVVPSEVPVLTPMMAEQVLDLLKGDRLRPLYITMLGLGLRFGEAGALSWADVDLDSGTARIRHSLGRVHGQWIHGDTKQHADVTLALPAVVVSALREQRRIQAEERLAAGPLWTAAVAQLERPRRRGRTVTDRIELDDLVFTTPGGGPIHNSTIAARTRQLCLDAGIPPMTTHEFCRHGAATLLRQAGASLDEIRELLRHRQIVTTQRYAHVAPELRRATADRMDGLLGG